MNCIHTQESLSQWIDGEFSVGIEAELFGHLRDCEECRAFFKNLLMLNHKLSSVQTLQVPASLDRRILSLPSSAKNPKSRIQKPVAGSNVFFSHRVPVRPGVHHSNSICFIILVSVFTFTAAANFRLPYSASGG